MNDKLLEQELVKERQDWPELGEGPHLSENESQPVVERGDWVEIQAIILPPGQRAPQVPPDTQAVGLEMRVRGFLMEEKAVIGEQVCIRTRSGRVVQGAMAERSPRYGHDFGQPQPELLAISTELRELNSRSF